MADRMLRQREIAGLFCRRQPAGETACPGPDFTRLRRFPGDERNRHGCPSGRLIGRGLRPADAHGWGEGRTYGHRRSQDSAFGHSAELTREAAAAAVGWQYRASCRARPRVLSRRRSHHTAVLSRVDGSLRDRIRGPKDPAKSSIRRLLRASAGAAICRRRRWCEWALALGRDVAAPRLGQLNNEMPVQAGSHRQSEQR